MKTVPLAQRPSHLSGHHGDLWGGSQHSLLVPSKLHFITCKGSFPFSLPPPIHPEDKLFINPVKASTMHLGAIETQQKCLN